MRNILKYTKSKQLLYLCLSAVILSCVFSLCAGCGSNTVQTLPVSENNNVSLDSTQSTAGGDVRVKIYWPEKAVKNKLIPSSTQSIIFTVSGQGLDSERITVIPYGTTETTIENLPSGNKTLKIKAVNGSGATLAHRIVAFVVNSGQTTNISAILGVSITSTGFIPQNITISANDTLYWVNSDDSASHKIISDGGGFPDSGVLAYGESYNHQFTAADTYNYYDNGNHALRGSVIVKGAPTITSLSTSTVTFGTAVTINGTNFGGSQGTSTVTFNGTTATNITSWSGTQIQCTVPVNVTSGNVVVTVDNQASNGSAFTINTPSISGLNVDTGMVGGSVTITGTNFGSSQGTSTVTFNSVSASITSWSNTQIVCTIPSTTTGNVIVTVAGNTSNGVSFTVSSGWTAQTSGVTSTIMQIVFLDASNGWAAGGSYCFKTVNGGSNWTAYNIGGYALQSISAVSTQKAWAVGSPRNFPYTTNGGSSWSYGDLWAYNSVEIFMINESIGWVTYDYGRNFRKTSNGGANWSFIYDANPYYIYSLHAENTSQIWGAGSGGRIVYSSNGGSGWSAQTSGTTNSLYCIWFTDVNNGWAVGEAGTILHTVNGGTNWSTQTSGTNHPLYGVCFVDSTHGWAVGASGIILYTTDGGSNWISQTSGTFRSLKSVSFIDITHGWVCGEGGVILYYN
ncbi:MAG: YCF48-related protein [Armatimonadota bacterium]